MLDVFEVRDQLGSFLLQSTTYSLSRMGLDALPCVERATTAASQNLMVLVAWMEFLPIPLAFVVASKSRSFDLIDRWPTEEKARITRPRSRFELDPFHPHRIVIVVQFDGEKGDVRDV